MSIIFKAIIFIWFALKLIINSIIFKEEYLFTKYSIMWLDAKKLSELDTDTNITILNIVWNFKDGINNSTNWVLDTNSCKWYCENNTKDESWNNKNCCRPEGCRNLESYDDGLNVKFTI